MLIIGLTGSVASGKSTVAGWIAQRGIAVHDADSAVHSLLAADGAAVPDIMARFGGSILADDGGIDRKKLGNHVFEHPQDRKILESILHPMLRQHRDQFLADHRRSGSKIVVLDVPLLFETGGDVLCDYVVVVYAGEDTIWRRALARPGMTKNKLAGILKTQMPVSEKCQRADFVLDTDLSPEVTRQHLSSWLDDLPLNSDYSNPDMSKGNDNA
ncbi:dephospho-CoA kinase [Alphaproteobacteria bacterium]|nr:dephospho-CoA kinase [Alphaproteobacteria bacterium]